MSVPASLQDFLDNKEPCNHGKLLKDCNVCGCNRCHKDIILADTEDWKRPCCIECWEQLGEPRSDPDLMN